LTSDSEAEIDRNWLEHPDDTVFKNILIGFARSGKAKEILLEYSHDEEWWVRELAKQLLNQYYLHH